MRRFPLLSLPVLSLLIVSCGDDSTGYDPNDTTLRYEFSEFRASPDSGCGVENIEFSVLANIYPTRDTFFEMTSGENQIELGLLRGTLFTGGGRVIIVNKQARRVREKVGYGTHTISITFRETAGEERTAGPLTLTYEAKECD